MDWAKGAAMSGTDSSGRTGLAYALSDATAERLPFAGMEFVIRASAALTGGSFSIVEEVNAVDAPPHVHGSEDELFFVLEGRHVFTYGQTEFEAGPGDTVFVPRGLRHAQRRVVPRRGRTLSMFSPAGFEEYFREISAADGAGLLDAAEMQRITQKYHARWVE